MLTNLLIKGAKESFDTRVFTMNLLIFCSFVVEHEMVNGFVELSNASC